MVLSQRAKAPLLEIVRGRGLARGQFQPGAISNGKCAVGAEREFPFEVELSRHTRIHAVAQQPLRMKKAHKSD